MEMVLDKNFFSDMEMQLKFSEFIINYLDEQLTIAKWSKLAGMCLDFIETHFKKYRQINFYNDFVIKITDDETHVQLSIKLVIESKNMELLKNKVSFLSKCDQEALYKIHGTLINESYIEDQISFDRGDLAFVNLFIGRFTFDALPLIEWNFENKEATLFFGYNIAKKNKTERTHVAPYRQTGKIVFKPEFHSESFS